jgi:hypothetical protein
MRRRLLVLATSDSYEARPREQRPWRWSSKGAAGLRVGRTPETARFRREAAPWTCTTARGPHRRSVAAAVASGGSLFVCGR